VPDAQVEHLCRRFYRGRKGRASLSPGVYFRLLLIGYFEGLDCYAAKTNHALHDTWATGIPD
jgi:hypothetical protein